jgi:hypothetical protein
VAVRELAPENIDVMISSVPVARADFGGWASASVMTLGCVCYGNRHIIYAIRRPDFEVEEFGGICDEQELEVSVFESFSMCCC